MIQQIYEFGILILVTVAFMAATFLIVALFLLVCSLFKIKINELDEIIFLIPYSYYFLIYFGLYFILNVYYFIFFTPYSHETFMLLGLILFYYAIAFAFNFVTYIIIWKYLSRKIILLTLIPYIISFITFLIFFEKF